MNKPFNFFLPEAIFPFQTFLIPHFYDLSFFDILSDFKEFFASQLMSIFRTSYTTSTTGRGGGRKLWTKHDSKINQKSITMTLCIFNLEGVH